MMKQEFQITGLAMAEFKALMSMTDEQLSEHHAHWLIADESPGYPCRVSLKDAHVGERVLAYSYAHHPADSAYRSSGPVFIREQATAASLAVGEVPPVLPGRQLSLRGYDELNLMITAELVAGAQVATAIRSMFAQSVVSYIHIHNAGPGCFSCAAKRVWLE